MVYGGVKLTAMGESRDLCVFNPLENNRRRGRRRHRPNRYGANLKMAPGVRRGDGLHQLSAYKVDGNGLAPG